MYFLWRVMFKFVGRVKNVYSKLCLPKSRFTRELCCFPNVPNTFFFHFFFALSQKSLRGRSKISASESFFRQEAESVIFVFWVFFLSKDFSSADTCAMLGQGSSE